MNFWTGLILGIIVGWLIEWIIDWLFWRREAEDAYQQELQRSETVGGTTELDREWEGRLSSAQQEYETRLRAVEDEWQSRLDLNEQQWHAKFQALETDNSELHSRLATGVAGATVAVATVAAAGLREDETVGEVDDLATFDEMMVGDAPGMTNLFDEEVKEEADRELDQPDSLWPTGQLTGDDTDLSRLDDLDEDMIERMNLAGIDSVESLAVADPLALSIALGIGHAETEEWINRAALTVPAAEMPEMNLGVDEASAEVVVDGVVVDGVAADMGKGSAVPEHVDDLTHIKGIGPRYAAVLANSGLRSYDDLAAATPGQLRDIIKPSVMQQINFDNWIAQAAAYAQSRDIQVGDDLTQLEGIGPTYSAKLREGGIATFADLAATDESTLAEIINAPAWRRINYSDWISQAQLAAIGDEIALRNLQDNLFSRSGDNLALINGLGGRSVAALQAAGITTYAALAAATPQDLESAIRGAGVRGSFDYDAWINEAGLRAAGRRVPSTRRARTTHVVSCPQDLSVVPGIGSVFEERLYAAGIGSYWELAETPRGDLVSILGPESLRGVDVEKIKAEAMQLAINSHSIGRSWNGTPPDDFEVLPGIGEIYERRLYEAGICTYDVLAATSVERLTEICQAPPMSTPDYAIWIATAAALAAERSG